MEQGIKDYYALLGVEPDAGPAAIKAAWKSRARALHPDLHPGDARKAEAFKQAAEAWRVLGSPLQRQMYDVSRASAARATAGSFADARARWQGQIRLLPWEALVLGAICKVFLAFYKAVRTPLSKPWVWLLLLAGLALLNWATWPAGGWIMAGGVLGAFALQVALCVYIYLRWAAGLLLRKG